MDYKVVAKGSNSISCVSAGTRGSINVNQAKQKLMDYLQDVYSGGTATVSIGVQNASPSKTGVCSLCFNK